ncbi:MAG: hypothetical protein HY917_04655 [Candidatus Diapherotrites archaeon]|nr:hypothetical protein [Candidatus Diapherotrites archaeon]
MNPMKGQITFDFILTGMVALSLIALLGFMANQIHAQQETISIQTQGQILAQGIQRMAGIEEELATREYDSVLLQFEVPSIRGLDGQSIPCSISITPTQLTIQPTGFEPITLSRNGTLTHATSCESTDR